jgi:hypothetical protein
MQRKLFYWLASVSERRRGESVRLEKGSRKGYNFSEVDLYPIK